MSRPCRPSPTGLAIASCRTARMAPTRDLPAGPHPRGTCSTSRNIRSRIQDRSATIGVVGLGYVGLPLAMEFAKAGFHVIGYDVSERVCALLMRGESHIQDVPASEVAQMIEAGRFEATTDESALGRC